MTGKTWMVRITFQQITESPSAPTGAFHGHERRNASTPMEQLPQDDACSQTSDADAILQHETGGSTNTQTMTGYSYMDIYIYIYREREREI